MINMLPDKPNPPAIVHVLRPHASAQRKAGMDMARIKMADTPDARNEASPLDKPA